MHIDLRACNASRTTSAAVRERRSSVLAAPSGVRRLRRDFDIDAFLEQPLIARLATVGPTVRLVWFLWERQAFWWLTGSWSALEQ